MSERRFPIIPAMVVVTLFALLGYAAYDSYKRDKEADAKATAQAKARERAMQMSAAVAQSPAQPEPKRKKTVADFLPGFKRDTRKPGFLRDCTYHGMAVSHSMMMRGLSGVQGMYTLKYDSHTSHAATDTQPLWVDALDASGFLLSRRLITFSPQTGSTLMTAAVEFDNFTSLHEFRAYFSDPDEDLSHPDAFAFPDEKDLELVSEEWRWVYTEERPGAVASSTAHLVARITLGNRTEKVVRPGCPVFFTNSAGIAIQDAGVISGTIDPGCSRTFQLMRSMTMTEATPINGVKVALKRNDNEAFRAELNASLKKR